MVSKEIPNGTSIVKEKEIKKKIACFIGVYHKLPSTFENGCFFSTREAEDWGYVQALYLDCPNIS